VAANILPRVDAVRTTGLVKRFESTTAIDGLDLAVAPSEVRGVLGPNGAGKTTLLRILFGLIRPDAGRVWLLGRELDEYGTTALQGVGGFVEEPSFYPYLSGRANLVLLTRLDGNTAARAEIERALGRVDLAHRADDRVSGYSTGMRQRLGIAAALLRRPRLLLLDEPTSGLDPAGARAIAALVRELAADGVAVLLSSHQIGELEKVCAAYTMLRDGRVVWDGTTAKLEAQAPASAYALATGDDDRALEIVAAHAGVRAQRAPHGGLALAARPGSLDAVVLALGDARVVIRRLELLVSPLESMFFALTADELPDQLEPNDLAERVLASAAG
jgi:ABC-2 type transport system ATP-binding protein